MHISLNYSNNQLAVAMVMMSLKMTVVALCKVGSKENQIQLQNGSKGTTFQSSFTKARIGEEYLLWKV